MYNPKHMKITIEIPDFVPPERIIFILAGIEKIGYIEPHTRKVFVKTSRCSRCGKCCTKIECEKLSKEPGIDAPHKCNLGDMRPFICCVSDSTLPECTSKYEELK